MFTTPLRSENMPPMPAKTSGVEKTNIDAIRSARKTVFRFSVLDWIARMPRPIPARPDDDGAPAEPALAARRPPRSRSATATMPTNTDQTIERASIGGIVEEAGEHAEQRAPTIADRRAPRSARPRRRA